MIGEALTNMLLYDKIFRKKPPENLLSHRIRSKSNIMFHRRIALLEHVPGSFGIAGLVASCKKGETGGSRSIVPTISIFTIKHQLNHPEMLFPIGEDVGFVAAL